MTFIYYPLTGKDQNYFRNNFDVVAKNSDSLNAKVLAIYDHHSNQTHRDAIAWLVNKVIDDDALILRESGMQPHGKSRKIFYDTNIEKPVRIIGWDSMKARIELKEKVSAFNAKLHTYAALTTPGKMPNEADMKQIIADIYAKMEMLDFDGLVKHLMEHELDATDSLLLEKYRTKFETEKASVKLGAKVSQNSSQDKLVRIYLNAIITYLKFLNREFKIYESENFLERSVSLAKNITDAANDPTISRIGVFGGAYHFTPFRSGHKSLAEGKAIEVVKKSLEATKYVLLTPKGNVQPPPDTGYALSTWLNNIKDVEIHQMSSVKKTAALLIALAALVYFQVLDIKLATVIAVFSIMLTDFGKDVVLPPESAHCNWKDIQALECAREDLADRLRNSLKQLSVTSGISGT
jgi:hypothetical protein